MTGFARIVIGCLLLFAYFSQRRAPMPLRLAHLRGYRILSDSMLPAGLMVLSTVEAALGVLLVLGAGGGAVLFLAAGFFLVLAAAMISVILRGLVTECGCFGSLASTNVGWHLVWRNTLLAALLVFMGITGTSFTWAADVSWVAYLPGLAVLLVAIGIEYREAKKTLRAGPQGTHQNTQGKPRVPAAA